MIDLLNIAAALITIALGAIGWLSPRTAASALDLQPAGSTMGLSELRASAGGLFVALGLGAILIGAPLAYLMLGLAYAGAALGRATSLVIDRPPLAKALFYFAVEAVLALWLILANL
ncbi:DUF4345 family protein [Poseidonocella sedimentorum]|uniref:DUF4345 domain-containing protein n=1 Tax=Poseidonocella sedimentorum TaxID=871652 RepID=A0A1I6DHH8_9RHOB|nr:DUF4345 family protein [Poseidonocella sedimentorum]SFR04841.1 protein of unknown function [Poseidonocella sedimentorum]